jgi:hypothetical protein
MAWCRDALSDKRTGLYFAVHITHWSESQRTRNHILLSRLRLGSLSGASYDSQGYSGGILTCLHTGHEEWNGVEFTTDSQLASMSWCRLALWGPWPDFACSSVWHVLASSCKYCHRTLMTAVLLRKSWQCHARPSSVMLCVNQLEYCDQAEFMLINKRQTHSNRIRWFRSSTSRYEASFCSSDMACHVTRAASTVVASAWEATAVEWVAYILRLITLFLGLRGCWHTEIKTVLCQSWHHGFKKINWLKQ